jgi:hypothetical protein
MEGDRTEGRGYGEDMSRAPTAPRDSPRARTGASAWRIPRSYTSQIVHAFPVRMEGTELKLVGKKTFMDGTDDATDGACVLCRVAASRHHSVQKTRRGRSSPGNKRSCPGLAWLNPRHCLITMAAFSLAPSHTPMPPPPGSPSGRALVCGRSTR